MFKPLLILIEGFLFLCLIQASSSNQIKNDFGKNLIATFFVQEEQVTAGDIVGINKQTGKVRPYRIGDHVIGVALPEQNKKQALVGIVGTLEFNPEQVEIYRAEVFTKDGQLIGQLLSNKKAYINISSNININPIFKKIKILRSMIKAEKLRNEIQEKQISELQYKLRELSDRR